MDKLYVIEYDNGESYEDHRTWLGEYFFESRELAKKYLLQNGYMLQNENTENEYFVEDGESWEAWLAQIIELKKYQIK